MPPRRAGGAGVPVRRIDCLDVSPRSWRWRCCALPSCPRPSPQPDRPARCPRSDRALVAEAKANGKDTVTILIAAETGANSVSRHRAQEPGRHGPLSRGHPRLHPGDRPDRQGRGCRRRCRGVQALEVDSVIPLPDPRPDGQTAPTPQTPPGPGTPRANPYMPIGDTGAAQFIDAHPTWDGRGVTVGVLDSGITLDHPALPTTTTGDAARSSTGSPYTHPTDDGDPTWVLTQTRSAGRRSRPAAPRTRHLPPARSASASSTSATRDLGGEVGNDVNRDGNPAGARHVRRPVGRRHARSGSTSTRTAASPTSRR